jgi:cell division protease FtsH
MKKRGSRRRIASLRGRSVMQHGARTALLVAAALCLAAIGAYRLTHPAPPPREQLTYTDLIAAIDGGRVSHIVIRPGQWVRGKYAEAPDSAGFESVYPMTDANGLAERAAAAGATVTFEADHPAGAPAGYATLILQVALLGGLGTVLFLTFRGQGMQRGIGRKATESSTTFASVAGTQGAAEELREVVDFLEEPAAFAAMGARVPKGVLLVGPPGTGKTLLARAVAGEAIVPFYHLSGSDVTGFVVGLGAHRIRALFARAKRHGGVIFIDEIDALGGARGSNRSHNEDDRTLNQLLVEMDGFSPNEGVVVIAATNRPDDLDPALKRPGRFDRVVTVGLPGADGREAILRLHSNERGMPLGEDVDLQRLARLTPGSSGAELANLLNEAAIAAVREHADRVSWSHFEQARDRMLLGKERVGFQARQREWNIVAVHEAGHALAGVVSCPEDGLHKVTIQPRGRAMGVAHFAPDDDRHLHSRTYLEAQIIKALGGRVAEEIVFGVEEITGGAESDLVHANRIARRMVYRLGMGRNGLLVHEPEAPLSAEMQARMDEEVRVMLTRLESATRDVLVRYRGALDALAAALLEHETLDGVDALTVLSRHGVPCSASLPRAS